jgi:hypothetical protein
MVLITYPKIVLSLRGMALQTQSTSNYFRIDTKITSSPVAVKPGLASGFTATNINNKGQNPVK